MTSGSEAAGASRRVDSAEAFQEVFGVSRETLDRFRAYEDLLKTWQRTINLVSPGTLNDIWHRHFADSAQLLGLAHSSADLALGKSATGRGEGPRAGEGKAPGGKSWLDLGSGGGFPGLVLAILLAERAPEDRMTLVESDTRKAAFLGAVARKTGVAVEIRAERSEIAATQAKSRTRDVITARALAPLPKLLGLVLPHFSPQTAALFPKGREAEVEVAEAAKRFDFDRALSPSLTDGEARIVIVRNLAARTEA